MQQTSSNRFQFIILVFSLFLIVSSITRTVLLFNTVDLLDLTLINLLQIYLIGAFYDFVAVSYLIIPFILYLFLVPQKIFQHKLHKYITYAFIYVLLFGLVFYAFSEWFFWDEFSVRFNFIAVDYLIYTTEVIGNIRESYPMGLLLSVITLISTLLFYMLYKLGYIANILDDKSKFKQR